MDENVEIELTYLAKYIPPGLDHSSFKDFHDLYIPEADLHPHLRLRKRGEFLELTKKIVIESGNLSEHREITLPLTQLEYDELATVRGRALTKRRFFLPYQNKIGQVDVFLDKLYGLIVVDFEFTSLLERDSFIPPDYCLANVTQEEFIAGGFLAGKTYEEIAQYLSVFNYERLEFHWQV